MTTKRLKILIVVMTAILIFILGFNVGHGEEILTEQQVQPELSGAIVETGVTMYTREDTKVELANKVNALIGDYSISYAIVNECTTQVYDNYKHCIQSVVGVANAESTLFTKGMKPSNNGFGLMYKGKKRKFSSVEESIQVWVSLYKKNNWAKRMAGKDWIGTYCVSECKHRARNYSNAVKKLGLD